MANIQKYIGEIISGKTAFKGVDFKKSILADFLKSGIMLFDNDSCAPFVQGAPLVELLTDRIYEGEHGQVAYEKVERAVSYYDQAKKKDSKLSYAFNYQFEDVGDITMTYEFFEKALKECGELSRENVFGVRAKDKSTAKSFTAHETLIVENMARFEEMFEEEYGKKCPYEDAATSIATILLLRAIAQKGEEDEIDNLAEQLYPFIVRSIKVAVAKKDYIGERKLYDIALDLAEQRIEKFNRVLGKGAIPVDLASLKRDEKIFSEIGRVNNKFKDYHINIYGVGANPPIGYVNLNGDIVVPDKVGVEIYDIIEEINDQIIGSVVDTHEEVFVSMLSALIHAETSDKYSAAARAQLEMVFALPLAQAVNALGDDKANELIKQTIDKLLGAEGIEIDKSALKKPTTTTRKPKKSEVVEEDQREPVEEVVPEEVVAPVVEEEKGASVVVPPVRKREPKPLTVEEVRKKFIKKFVSENNKYYQKIGAGKVKATEVVAAHENVTMLAGILGLEGKRLVSQPAEYVAEPKVVRELPSAVMTEFADAYLVAKAEEIVRNAGETEEEIEATKQAIDSTKKEIGRFYTSRVKNGQISVEQVLGRDDK